MTEWYLAAAFVTGVLASLGYGYVGVRLYARPVSPASRLAVAQFSVWWLGLGATTALTAVESLLAFAGVLTVPAALTFLLLVVLVDVALLWGLVGFLIYVYTGRYHLVPLTAFYAVFYAAALYYEVLAAPYAFAVQSGVLTFSTPTVSDPVLTGFVIVGLVVPELVGAVLYLSLLRRTRDRVQRYRIALVGSSLFLWFAISALVPSSTGPWVVAKNLLEVVPALLSLIAYFPPESIRRRLRWTEPVVETVGGTARSGAPPEG
ncbi:MAG TPA: hypothetical protein VMG99_07715 [Thermoplasmata archaeon]|nr:hypothetical protein [Thermoplasmata archaeon]